jgi:hypothetical protein
MYEPHTGHNIVFLYNETTLIKSEDPKSFKNKMFIFLMCIYSVSRDSAVGIATGYGLDD